MILLTKPILMSKPLLPGKPEETTRLYLVAVTTEIKNPVFPGPPGTIFSSQICRSYFLFKNETRKNVINKDVRP